MAIKDKDTLQSEKDTALASGKAGGITAADHRGVVTDVIDSYGNLAELDLQTFDGPVNFNAKVNMFGNGGVVPIYSSADIPTPAGIPTFEAGITYEIQAPIPDWPTQGVVMEDFSCCFDKNMIGNKITMAGTGTMFHGSGSVYLRGLALDCPDGQFYDFVSAVDGQGIMIIEKNQNFTCADAGNFDGHAITVIDFSKIDDAGQGFTFSGVNKFVHSISRVAISTTEGAGFVAVDHGNMVSTFLEYDLLTFSGAAGSFAFSGLPNSGNIGPDSVATVTGIEVSGGMTTLNGLSADDTGYKYTNVDGVDDSTVLVCGYVTSSVATDVQDGVDVVVNGTYAQSALTTQGSMSAAGTIQVFNRITSKSFVNALMVIDKLGAGSDTYRFAIQQDVGGVGTWVELPESVKTIVTQGAETPTVLLRAPARIINGDLFRVVVRGVGTGENISLVSNVFTVQKA